jgi:hypothetical protein
MLLVFPFSIVTAVRVLFSLLPYTFVLLCVGLLTDEVVLSNLSVPPWVLLFYFFFVLFSRTIIACDGKATLIARVVFMFVCIVHSLQFPNHLRNTADKRHPSPDCQFYFKCFLSSVFGVAAFFQTSSSSSSSSCYNVSVTVIIIYTTVGLCFSAYSPIRPCFTSVTCQTGSHMNVFWMIIIK